MTQDRRKQKWMADFEQRLVSLDSRFVGRIDWSSAIFLFDQDKSPIEAAERFIVNQIQPMKGR